MSPAFFLVACAAVMEPAGAARRLIRYEASELHMGTQFTIVLYATDDVAANRGLRSAFTRIRDLDARLSDYQAQSELNQLSDSAPADLDLPPRPFTVSDDLWRVLVASHEVSVRSEGAFDVTIGPLTRLWRRARRQKTLPSNERLAEAVEAVGYHHLQLDPCQRTVTLRRPKMRLDLGGIAKGFAADEALAQLRRAGIDSALVNAGGDISTSEAPPDKPGWRVAISELDPQAAPVRFMHLQNRAVATSGDAWQFVQIAGQRYSHIVDPRTGIGLTRRVRVSVVGRDGMTADSLASALSVIGPEMGIPLARDWPDVEAMILQWRDGKIVRYETPDWSRLSGTQ